MDESNYYFIPITMIYTDSTDLPVEVFLHLFVQDEKFTPQAVELIVEWNQSLDPSFNMVKNQFKKFVEADPNNSSLLCKQIIAVSNRLVEAKCPRNFMRAYFATLKSINQGGEDPGKLIINKQMEELSARWKEVDLQILEPYFQAFGLRQKVSQQEIDLFVEQLIVQKKYNNCLSFIKFLGVKENKDNIQKLVGKMSNKRDASKAADYVKSLKLNPKDYPALGERLYKNTARHFLTKHGWEYAEEIFQDFSQALACIVEDLIFKKKISEAKSILSRHPIEQFMQKEESRQILKAEENRECEIAVNFLHKDEFGSCNSEKYLELSTFGFGEKDIVWVDRQHPNLQKILAEVEAARVLGIDTESIVGQTKFQKTEEAALIQVSTEKAIFLFDGFRCADPRIAATFQKCFNETIIIGHSFTNDTEGMMLAFGVDPKKEIRIKKLVDICKVYKSLHPDSKYSSLAHICKEVLGKELDKNQTLTNWKRRPLRRNQTHYAALDAHVVIEVYNKFVKEYGQMVSYYAEIDNDSL